MIDGLVHDFVLRTKARTGASGELVIWAFVVAILSVIAVVFLSVAAYMFVAGLYGGAVAGAAVGCFHFFVAGAVVARCVILRRRTRALALAEAEAAAKQPAWWLDPSVLAVGIEVAKIIGWRKLAPIAAAGFLAASLSSGRGQAATRPN